MQRQTAVIAYFSSKQLLLFAFAGQYRSHTAVCLTPEYLIRHNRLALETNKRETLIQCRFNVWPASQTLVQHWTDTGSKSRGCRDKNNCGERRHNSSMSTRDKCGVTLIPNKRTVYVVSGSRDVIQMSGIWQMPLAWRGSRSMYILTWGPGAEDIIIIMCIVFAQYNILKQKVVSAKTMGPQK